MKKLLAMVLSVLLLMGLCSTAALAATPEDTLLSRSEEILENGDYIVTELYKNAIQPRTGTSGYSTSTYYNASGNAIWDLTVQGYFSYTYGVSSTATSAEATVRIFNSNASFVSKNAYTSGNTATATGSITYRSIPASNSVSISCDKYGNLY